MSKRGRSESVRGDLEAALEREKQDRADAEERARRANERASQADEAYRKLQLSLVASQDEATAATDEKNRAQEKLEKLALEVEALRAAAAAAPPPAKPPSKAPSAPPEKSVAPAAITTTSTSESAEAVTAQLEDALARIQGLRELLAMASVELSQLRADEVLLSEKRTRVLSDACALLQRAVGATGQAPPPIPSARLEARLSMSPVVDISEVADLIESLRPPLAPKGD